jgi:acetyl-CoA carboxylase biotin carboxylase subunit
MPVVPGVDEPLDLSRGEAAIRQTADEVGYPLLVKAVAGGGGKGMRTVTNPEDVLGAVRAAGSEAGSAFGDAAVYFERKLRGARHVEIQLLADHHGTIVPFVERECSIQRRHQKVVEESPSVAVTPALRRAMAEAAVSVARSVGYTNAGTIETLLDRDGKFYFLEMNTRLQVEHPVTELVTGVDLVQWQLRLAMGERLSLDAERMLLPDGHAIECRIYAEDPDRQFMPSPGLIRHLEQPSGPGVRCDSGVHSGVEIPIFYDSLISKLSVWGENRTQAVARLRRALSEYQVHGIRTTIPLFQWLTAEPEFLDGRFDTTYLDAILASRAEPFVEASGEAVEIAVIATAIRAFTAATAPSTTSQPAAPVSRWRLAGRQEALRG